MHMHVYTYISIIYRRQTQGDRRGAHAGVHLQDVLSEKTTARFKCVSMECLGPHRKGTPGIGIVHSVFIART